MKKTLTALAVLGTFAGGALAANVELYGLIDESILHSNGKVVDANGGTTRLHKNELLSGLIAGPRVGLKGTEDLGNGWKVGFVLENGFDIDNGAFGQGGLLFGRESVLTLEGDIGKFYAGRISTIACDGGSIGILQHASPFGNSFGEVASMYLSTGSQFARYDNTIAYVAPTMNGLQMSAMYSMGEQGKENKASANRYAVVGMKYANGPLTAVGTVEYTVYGHDVGEDVDNGLSVIVGGNYKLDNGVGLYGKVNWFDNVASIGEFYSNPEFDITSALQAKSFDGYGLELAATVPVCGGNMMVGAGYRAAEADLNGTTADVERYNVAVGYMYSMSKRTTLYGIVGYAQEEVKDTLRETKIYQAGVGVIHTF